MGELLYKVSFVAIDNSILTTEYASAINANVVKGLWGKENVEVVDGGFDKCGDRILILIDDEIEGSPLRVKGELIADMS